MEYFIIFDTLISRIGDKNLLIVIELPFIVSELTTSAWPLNINTYPTTIIEIKSKTIIPNKSVREAAAVGI
jgi:hypothetical protein